jgi:hypothetical protein
MLSSRVDGLRGRRSHSPQRRVADFAEFRFWKQKILRLVFLPFLFQVFPIRSFVPPFVENAIFLGGSHSVWGFRALGGLRPLR